MANLYNELADVYEAMYQTFIDYHDEYVFYSEIIKKYKKENLLEIGSGTGNLAHYFIKNKSVYIGLDYSKEMINIAKVKNLYGKFIHGDMRDFQLAKPVQSTIITGRTISYLLKNDEVNSTFSAIHKNLEPGGIVCFDFIDANKFIPSISKSKKITHKAVFQNTQYVRESLWSLNLEHGMCLKWDSAYFKKEKNEMVKIGQDNSIVRTFTLNEMEIFLLINSFKIKEVIERPSYAFPTFVIVAESVGLPVSWGGD